MSSSTKKGRVQKSTKNKDRFTKKRTKVRHSVSTFNSLPIEIIKEIFCNLACYDLLEMERVCQLWNRTIHELLDIKSLPIDISREDDAAELFSSKKRYRIHCSLDLYRAPYRINDIIDDILVAKLGHSQVHYCEQASYSEVFNILREVAFEYADWAPYALWRAALSFTGLEDPCKQLKKQGFGGEFAKSNLSKYEWYTLLAGYRDNIGVVAVYPDNRTFSVFIYPDDPRSVEVCTDSSEDSDNIDWEAAQGYNDDEYPYHMVDEFDLYDALY